MSIKGNSAERSVWYLVNLTLTGDISKTAIYGKRSRPSDRVLMKTDDEKEPSCGQDNKIKCGKACLPHRGHRS